MLLWHDDQPVGICIFGYGPLASSARNRVFGLHGRGLSRHLARQINRDFASVVRLVIDPRYRGAGLAAAFLRRCCQLTDWPWIELISQMADLVPFCQAAGFRRVGDWLRFSPPGQDPREQANDARLNPSPETPESGEKRCLSPASPHAKLAGLSPGRQPNRGPYGRSNWTDAAYAAYLRRSRFSKPAYFLFDNRKAHGRLSVGSVGVLSARTSSPARRRSGA